MKGSVCVSISCVCKESSGALNDSVSIPYELTMRLPMSRLELPLISRTIVAGICEGKTMNISPHNWIAKKESSLFPAVVKSLHLHPLEQPALGHTCPIYPTRDDRQKTRAGDERDKRRAGHLSFFSTRPRSSHALFSIVPSERETRTGYLSNNLTRCKRLGKPFSLFSEMFEISNKKWSSGITPRVRLRK